MITKPASGDGVAEATANAPAQRAEQHAGYGISASRAATAPLESGITAPDMPPPISRPESVTVSLRRSLFRR